MHFMKSISYFSNFFIQFHFDIHFFFKIAAIECNTLAQLVKLLLGSHIIYQGA